MFKIFDILMKRNKAKEQLEASKPPKSVDFDDIWFIEDKNEFLTALGDWLCKKSDYGKDIEKLSDVEKTFYFVFELESEVNNGGFSQFFYNSSGKFAHETVNALHEIGADRTAEICKNAISDLGVVIPKEHDERQAMMDMLPEATEGILDGYDQEFYEYPDDLEDLSYEYILNNKSKFTRG